MAEPRKRSTDAQRRERELEALQLLSQGYGSAHVSQTMAARHGVSLRQARRYVAVAALDLVGEMTPHSLDTAAGLTLHRLDLVAGQAMESNDADLAVRASRAHAAALAQFRRAITAPNVRFRLPDARPPNTDPPPEDLPF